MFSPKVSYFLYRYTVSWIQIVITIDYDNFLWENCVSCVSFSLFFYDCGWQAVPTSAHLHIVKRFWLRLETSFHPHSAGKQGIFTLLWKSLKQSRKTVCRNSELFIWLRVRLRNYVWDVALLHSLYGTGWDGGPTKALGDTPANWVSCNNMIHFFCWEF